MTARLDGTDHKAARAGRGTSVCPLENAPLSDRSGGQGGSWVAGELVMKPGGDPAHEWLAEALGHVTVDGFRLATPDEARRYEHAAATIGV